MFLEMWRDQAKIYGIDPDKLQVAEKQRATIGNNNNEDEDDEEINLIKEAISEKINGKDKQQRQRRQTKIVNGENELLSCMNDGWNLVKELTDNRFLVSY